MHFVKRLGPADGQTDTVQGQGQPFAQSRQLHMRGATGAQIVFSVHFNECRRHRIVDDRLEVNRLEADADLPRQAAMRRRIDDALVPGWVINHQGRQRVQSGENQPLVFFGLPGVNAFNWPKWVGEVLEAVVRQVPAGTYFQEFPW